MKYFYNLLHSANTTHEESQRWKHRLQVFAPKLWPPPPVNQLGSAWKETVSIVVVRDPLARLASLYFQKFVKLAKHETWAPLIKSIIKKFREDPNTGDKNHITPDEMLRYLSCYNNKQNSMSDIRETIVKDILTRN